MNKFVDYYKVLEIEYPSTKQEIKKSYRRLSIKWHPDRNSGIDTTKQMVAINEAYAILNDGERKLRYDQEYCIYKQNKQKSTSSDLYYSEQSSKQTWDYEGYHFHNDKVKDDINDAHAFAKDLVEEFLKNLKEASKDAAKGAWSEMSPYLIVLIILPIFFALIRSCQ